MRPDPAPLAGIVSRAAAFSADAVIALVVATLGYGLALAVLGVVGVTPLARATDAAVRGYVVALPVVFGAYCVAFWTLVGRTPGMMVLGLRVITVDGRPLGVVRSIVRALGYWVSAIAFAGFLWIAVDARRQGFHDKLAGTLVVYDWGRDGRGPG